MLLLIALHELMVMRCVVILSFHLFEDELRKVSSCYPRSRASLMMDYRYRRLIDGYSANSIGSVTVSTGL